MLWTCLLWTPESSVQVQRLRNSRWKWVSCFQVAGDTRSLARSVMKLSDKGSCPHGVAGGRRAVQFWVLAEVDRAGGRGPGKVLAPCSSRGVCWAGSSGRQHGSGAYGEQTVSGVLSQLPWHLALVCITGVIPVLLSWLTPRTGLTQPLGHCINPSYIHRLSNDQL